MTNEPRITPKDLGRIPRKVATLICELVNDYGVRYRVPGNSNHVLLYNGDSKSQPFKVSQHRPEEHSLQFIHTWIKDNVPDYGKKPTTPTKAVVGESDIKALAEAINTGPSGAAKVVPTLEKVDTTGRKPVVDGDGKNLGYDTDGTLFYCRQCDYSRPNRQGFHLHTQSHDPERMAKVASAGGQANSLKRQQREVMVASAFDVLADHLGFKVVDKSVDPAEVVALKQQVADLKTERDDLKARLDLMREALRA